MKHDMTRHIMDKIARAKEGLRHTLSILFEYAWSMARVWLEYAWSMPRVWVEYASTLLSGGQKLCADEITSRPLRDYVSLLTRLRLVVTLLLMMMVGVNETWADDDYSGTYYIRSGSVKKSPSGDYYLCPTDEWAYFYAKNNVNGTDNGQPFLTTHLMDSEKEAMYYKWIIEKHTEGDHDYYAFKYGVDYESSSRYLSYNRQLTGAGIDRMRIHLEKKNSPGDYELFDITPYSTYLVISPKKGDEDATGTPKKYLVVNGGNTNFFKGKYTSGGGVQEKKNGPSTEFEITTGIIGTYTIDDANAPFYLDDVITRPTITYNNANDKIEITHPDASTDNTFKYYYTKDGSKPEVTIVGQTISPKSTTTKEYTGPFTVAANVATVKAIAVRISDNEVSNVTAFSVPIHCGVNYVIQSKESAFYYLIPNLKISDTNYPKNLTTLNVPCSTMVWDFEDASDGDGEYYYIHNSQGGYLYYTDIDNSDNKYVFFNADKNTSGDGYKFSITRHTSGGYNIIPKGQTTPINKSSIAGSSDDIRLSPVKLAGSEDDATSRWEILPYTSTASLPQWTNEPFKVWDNGNKFYQIKSVQVPTKSLVLANDGSIKTVEVSTTDYDIRKSIWVAKKVGSDTDGLLDYYTFQNTYTGELLYYNGRGRGVKVSIPVLQMGMPDVEGANETWSHFVVVQTLSGYNIIPRAIIDNTKAISKVGSTDSPVEGFNCINRAGGNDSPGTWYDNDGNSRWTFVEYTEDVQCMKPIITYQSESEKIRISTIYDNATIYYTINDDDPKDSGVTPTSFETTTTLYTEIDLSTVTGKVKAYVSKTGYTDSDTETYTISFEAPVISYDAINDKIIITPSPGATVYYTTGETAADDPTETETQKYTYGSTGFVLADDINVIKAKAVKGAAVSDVVTLTIPVHAHTATNDRPYLIQSVQSSAFYMIPGDVDKDVTYVNTSSFGRSSMEWYFIGAGHENDVTYYYIKNKATNEYVCYTSSSVRLHTAETFDAAADKDIYKFTINYAETTNPGYYIHPVTNATPTNGLSKDKGNNEINVFNLASATTANNTSARWKFILSADKPALSPQLKVWGSDGRKYYKIKKNNATDATATYLVPRTQTVSYAMVSVAADVSGPANSILWYFDVAYSDEWVTYYYVVNAATGEYLYFNGVETKSANDNALEAREELVAADNDRYLFAFAKTTSSNQYYFLPKVLQYKDQDQGLVKNSYSLVYWDGTSALTTAADRAAGNGKWYLAEADVTELCPPRLALDENGNVTISSRTRGATIKYKVGSETDFNNNAIPQMADDSQVVITTQTTLGGAETIWPVTVVYKPTVTLAEQSVVYNGQAQAPELSSVTMGDVELTNYCAVSSNDFNAGDATAVITQKENNPFYADPYYVIYGTAPFTIEKSPLTIYADSKTVEYGDPIPELSFSTSGLASTDVVEVNLSCASGTEIGNYPVTFNGSYTITRDVDGADASSNYKDVTLVPSSLIITGKSLGDGTHFAEGITAEVTPSGGSYNVSIMRNATSLDDADYEATSPDTKGYYNDKIWTITGKGHYAGSAKFAFIQSDFTERDGEYRAAYVASYDWAIPEGSNIEAWIATTVNPSVNVLQVKSVDYLPAGVPVVLTATVDKSDGFVVYPKSNETADITNSQKEDNKLKVVTAENGITVNDREKYVYSKGEFVLAYGGLLSQGKIYIDRPANVSGARLRIVKDDNVTGISDVSENNKIRFLDDIWYSLDGRKLSGRPSQKGIYINNGRKIVVN